MLKAISYCVAASLTLSTSVFIFAEDVKPGEAQAIIVQGDSQAAMQQEIQAAGGEVTHSFSVIQAVSASLTEQQMEQLKTTNPTLRFFVDTDVEVSGKKSYSASDIQTTTNKENILIDGAAMSELDGIPNSQKPMHFDLSNNTVEWTTTNRAQTVYQLQQAIVTWPSSNGILTQLDVANEALKLSGDKNYTVEASDRAAVITFKNKKGMKLSDPSISLRMAFDNMSSTSEDDYQVALTMSDGTVLSNSQSFNANVLSQGSPIFYTTQTNALSWKTYNRSAEKRQLLSVTFDWPEANGLVEKFKINELTILEDAKGGTAHAVLAQALEIDEGGIIEVEMEFSNLQSVNDLDYGIVLGFEDGSFEELTTTNILPIQDKFRDTFYPSLVRADEAHARGITGNGVTVAIIDTGIDSEKEMTLNTVGEYKSFHVHNVLDKKEADNVVDENGHGTHIASIIGNSNPTVGLDGQLKRSYSGIAPDADLVIVKAFDEQGSANYNRILQAIEYVIDNKDVLNIKVLNLSFSAKPSSYYWDDPINQAVMRAWEAGITVVAAAGNQGPEAMTIGVPGNTPYVITVGATSDNYTPTNTSDDLVTTFSSAGPTFEGFVKPEIVAPGGHIQGLMDSETFIGKNYPIYHDQKGYFVLSGSSQSTAITSGIVALMLQNDPSLTPDDIKCRLMYTAKVAVKDDGHLAYSVFQQGAGLVDAISAIDESAVGCGNAGLDIAADLAGEDHFIGPARRYENDGDFYIPGTEGMDWNGVYQDSQLWGNVRFMSNSQLWGNVRFDSSSQLWGNVNSDSQLWGNVRFNSNSQLWGNIRFNSDSQLWGNVRFLSDSQLWGNVHFNSNSQLWGNVKFASDTNSQGRISFDAKFDKEWVDQE